MTDRVPLLTVDDLHVQFAGRSGTIRAVDGVSFTVNEGQTLGLVGESGCGKSTTARAIVGLVPVTSGRITYDGERIDNLSAGAFRPFRRDIQMVFQDPYASLNPRMTVGDIIGEPLEIHRLASRTDRRLEVIRLMELVGLNTHFLNRYPHEFSGGQRQRIGIARALALSPRLIVCDEPVSALDVSIQSQVINLLMDLQQRLGLAYLFIAHDLAVVRHISHRVAVMYLGRIVEEGRARDLFQHPKHPYTQALLSAAPIPDPSGVGLKDRIQLTGEVPSPDQVYPGCRFAPRCPRAEAVCREVVPDLEGDGDHRSACLLAADHRQLERLGHGHALAGSSPAD